MRRLPHLLRCAGLLVALLLVGWLGGFVWFLAASLGASVDRTSPTDAIVVLTGGKMRLETGIELLASGKAGKLFVSGVNPTIDRDTLLGALGPVARREACCIVLGHAADDTHGNARETAVWMQQENYRSLRLVTSWYHMRRSLLEFGREMPKVRVIAHPVFPRDSEPEDWRGWLSAASLVFFEYNKYLLAWVRQQVEPTTPLPVAPIIRTATPAGAAGCWAGEL